MKKTLLALGAFAILAGCGSTKVSTMDMQHMASNKIGLASTDELNIVNVQESQPDAIGGVIVNYEAHTTKGKKYKCSYRVAPGLTMFDKPNISNHQCSL